MAGAILAACTTWTLELYAERARIAAITLRNFDDQILCAIDMKLSARGRARKIERNGYTRAGGSFCSGHRGACSCLALIDCERKIYLFRAF